MGVGIIVIGLVLIILVEVMIKYLFFGKRLWLIVLGFVLYCMIIVFILIIDIDV